MCAHTVQNRSTYYNNDFLFFNVSAKKITTLHRECSPYRHPYFFFFIFLRHLKLLFKPLLSENRSHYAKHSILRFCETRFEFAVVKTYNRHFDIWNNLRHPTISLKPCNFISYVLDRSWSAQLLKYPGLNSQWTFNNISTMGFNNIMSTGGMNIFKFLPASLLSRLRVGNSDKINDGYPMIQYY